MLQFDVWIQHTVIMIALLRSLTQVKVSPPCTSADLRTKARGHSKWVQIFAGYILATEVCSNNSAFWSVVHTCACVKSAEMRSLRGKERAVLPPAEWQLCTVLWA